MVELRLIAAEDEVEALSETLMELEALSVSVEDADADTEAEQALFGEPDMPVPKPAWQRSVLKALFGSASEATDAATRLLAEHPQGVELQALVEVPDEDWVRLTQSQFAPVPITDDFWIVPTWHEAPPAARTVMRLDPGLAFGTGTHPTTRMCLRWIATHAEAFRGRPVLDYGCGSGILAIAARQFGAGETLAVDIDPAAVISTTQNAEANGVTVQPGLPDAAGEGCGRYPLVLANILASPLKLLAPLLAGHLAPGGHLVLAGILERQAEELQAAYALAGLALTVADQEDGWILMHARRSTQA